MSKIIKTIFSFLFITILITQYFNFINNNEKTTTVFNQSNADKYNYYSYLVDFKNILNTKNLYDKLSILSKDSYQIKKLYLEINDSWNDNAKKTLSEYSFDNLNNFFTYYKKTLQKHNLSDLIPNIDVSGIRINKVLFYTSITEIEKLKNQYNIEYEKK